MASFLSSALHLGNPIPHFSVRRKEAYRIKALAVEVKLENGDDYSQKSTRLVTFLGKGGSGKTTSAVFAAKHYAKIGLSTCLVIHSQDSTADHLLDCKIGTSPLVCSENLSAVRLETTKMILEPLYRLKQADTRINMTQGVLEGIVGEELGVLPGMDSIFTALELERFLGFFKLTAQKNNQKDRFDVIVYDGISTEEMLRMIGAASKARLYLKYLRNMAEKTDIGRLAGPSLLRLVEEAINITGTSSSLNGKMSYEIWDILEQMLEKGSSTFFEPRKFGCFIVMDSTNPISVNCALRYWGCSIQAGAQISGAFGINSSAMEADYKTKLEEKFSPLPFAQIPQISIGLSQDWDEILADGLSNDARNVLSSSENRISRLTSSVKFDPEKKSITLLMPGFDKSEIKLYQYRGGSELLVEAGDQRRLILLPKQIQGKVGAAKFMDRSLVITMR